MIPGHRWSSEKFQTKLETLKPLIVVEGKTRDEIFQLQEKGFAVPNATSGASLMDFRKAKKRDGDDSDEDEEEVEEEKDHRSE